MKKTILSIVCLGVMLIMCLGVFCACNCGEDDFRNPIIGEPADGEFYSLKEAYEQKLLTKADLDEIAELYNNNAQQTESLDLDISEKIKFDYYNSVSSQYAEMKVDDVSIEKFYGVHNGVYAIIIENPFVNYPAVIVDEWEEIGGVQFHHTGFLRIAIWKEL